MRPLTISELEQESGVGRGAVYHYISIGLLPASQKARATRALYDQSHVDLLSEIARLKAEGLSLREIRGLLAERIETAQESGVDLVATQDEANRDAILQAAARRFAAQGYEKTRVADICKDVGVSAQLLYSHFPGKKHLFIACFEVYFRWMNAQVSTPIEQATDSATRQALRVWAGLGLQSLSRDLQAMARVEAFHPHSDLQPMVRKVYEEILAGSAEELSAERKPEANPGLFSDELVSYGLLGVLENMLMRATWDDRFTNEDIMRNLVGIFLAVRAAYQGRVDLAADWQQVSGLVTELTKNLPAMAEESGRRGSE
jgi:AcrR family transcriptional regulator